MRKNAGNSKLTQREQELEESFDTDEWKSLSPEETERYRQNAAAFLESQGTTAISLRVKTATLEAFKREAGKRKVRGYQTLINAYLDSVAADFEHKGPLKAVAMGPKRRRS